LIAYHSQRLTKSAKLVEEEQWNQIDVTQVMQHNVNLLIEAAVSDPEECFIPPRLPISNGAENGLSRTLDVEEKKFFVVKATAESIGLLRDYLGVSDGCHGQDHRILKGRQSFVGSAHHLVVQLSDLSGRARCWSYAISRAQEYHCKASG
jgi:hypothetical protein